MTGPLHKAVRNASLESGAYFTFTVTGALTVKAGLKAGKTAWPHRGLLVDDSDPPQTVKN